ncbi:MAG: hemoglobin [Planctomycetota bacterium]
MTHAPRTRPVFTPPGGPPQGSRPSSAIFEAMGEDGLFAMFEAFYSELGESDVRHLFPEDLLTASQRSAAFFVQLLGGPPLFSERYGPPRMRQRHLPFEIDDAARQVWLACFDKILNDAPARFGFPEEQLAGFREFLTSFSTWMVNVES